MKILLWPNPALTTPCQEVKPGDQEFKSQLEELKATMRLHGGLGLAANQVGIHKRMLVAVDHDGIKAFVNPRILAYPGDWVQMQEGCLSLPGVFLRISRNTRIVLEQQDVETGAMTVSEIDGRLAHILQHEIEHLDGKMMTDKVPRAQRDQVRAAMKRWRR